jgi:hypothetical protein
VVTKVRERLAASKQTAQKYDEETFVLKKINELDVRKQYQTMILNRFAALENLSGSENINRAWEKVKKNIKTSAKSSLSLHEWQQYKPWFDEECLGYLDQRKQAKMQWFQDPNQRNVDNANNVRRDANSHFRNKKKEYLKAKID